MSIMPEGGWHKLPQLQDDDHGSQNIRPTQSNYLPRRSHLTCKVCDRGTLESKAVYRMSGPAVVIGFILLIPSIIGMVSCALMLLVFNTSVGVALGSNAVAPRRIHQSAEDATFRKSCKEGFLEAETRLPGVSASQFCECAISRYKVSGSIEGATDTCAEKAREGTLEQPSPEVEALYSRGTSTASNAGLLTALGVFGSAFFLAWGIACFVSGLLGWLLVMKKRILQCDVCSAVVNAS